MNKALSKLKGLLFRDKTRVSEGSSILNPSSEQLFSLEEVELLFPDNLRFFTTKFLITTAEEDGTLWGDGVRFVVFPRELSGQVIFAHEIKSSQHPGAVPSLRDLERSNYVKNMTLTTERLMT